MLQIINQKFKYNIQFIQKKISYESKIFIRYFNIILLH